MDPFTGAALATTVVPLVSGAAGEAGKQAWASLTGFITAKFGRDSRPAEALDAVERQPDDESRAALLGETLHRLAQADPDIDTWLRAWLAEAAPLAATSSQVLNTIGGQATVHGPVVQAHTITGSVTFSAPPPTER